MVSDEAKDIIIAYKKLKKYSTLDESVSNFIIDNGCTEATKLEPSGTP